MKSDEEISAGSSAINLPPWPGAKTKPRKTETAEPQLTLPLEAAPEPEKVDWRAQVPTVSQLTRRVRGHLESAFLDVWVRGEISNFKKPVSGHAYFCLKDATAQLRAVMFRPALSKVKFTPRDGTEILLHGKLTVYEARGDYQMVCDAMEPVGVGALQLAFEQLKQGLAKEGLFEAKYKKRLPALPRHIGIVTSATGAAVRDILKVLARRYPDRRISILPASVQGEKAAGEIVEAIRLAEKWNRESPAHAIDVLIVGRGGGSLEDLWPFNEEIVARAIFQCAIPIISAVGHEIDFTIADFVADVRAPTPSAAAEMVIPRKEDLARTVEIQRERLTSTIRARLEQLRLHLGHLGNRLIDPRQKIGETRRIFALMREKLDVAMTMRLKLARKQLEGQAQMLHSLSPLAVIGRGYSITETEDGRIVRSVEDVGIGTKLVTRVADGTILSETVTAS